MEACTPFLTVLREKTTSMQDFRTAADQISHVLATEAYARAETKRLPVETPMGSAEGTSLRHPTTLIPILRSGLVMLSPFLHYFTSASVGVLGIQRNETTKRPSVYYSHLPPLHRDDSIIIIDPMLATAGTAIAATEAILATGHPEEKITFCGIICAEEGLALYSDRFPKVTTIIAATDPELNTDKFIVPGLGDFGDRYFGTPA